MFNRWFAGTDVQFQRVAKLASIDGVVFQSVLENLRKETFSSEASSLADTVGGEVSRECDYH